MDISIKIIFGTIAPFLALVSFIPYFRMLALRKIKPHAFSWLIWGASSFVGFFVGLSKDAGPGIWILGVVGVINLIIFIISLFIGEKNIKRVDWISLCCVVIAFAIWLISDSALLSVLLISFVDIGGFIPTIRKSYYKPYQEDIVSFSIRGVAFAMSITALTSYQVITWLYLAVIAISIVIFITLVVLRRRITPEKEL